MVQKRQAIMPDAILESLTVGLKKVQSNDLSNAISHTALACSMPGR